MPSMCAGPTGGGVYLPPHIPVEQALEFSARFRELYPQATTEPYLSMAQRVRFEPEEIAALLENPDGPRLMWHFLCRAMKGMDL